MGRHLGAARAASLVDGSGITAAYATCRSLRDRSNLPRYTGPWNRGKGPVLLLNETHDQATSLAWAQRMKAAPGSPLRARAPHRIRARHSCTLQCRPDVPTPDDGPASRQGNTVQRRAHTNPFVS